MMIKPAELVAKFRYALDNKWGYIANTAGQLWTSEKQAATKDKLAIQYGKKWIGHYVADCSGLFSWAFKQLGGYIYHGSNTMYRNYCTKTGRITSPPPVGAAVFKRQADPKYIDGWDYYHVGLYIGDNVVIEAQGTRTGVVRSNLSTWSYYGLLKGVDYGTTIQNEVVQMPNLVGIGSAVVDVPNDGSVNVRHKPTKSSNIAIKLAEGTKVDVLENDGKWAKIEYKGTGYIMSEYLKNVDKG